MRPPRRSHHRQSPSARAWHTIAPRRDGERPETATPSPVLKAPRLFVVRCGYGADGFRDAVRRDRRFERFADLGRDLVGDVGVLLEERLRVLAALADALLAVGVPRARLADDVALERDVDDRAHLRDPLAVGDVEFGHAERWRDLVLDDLDAGARADDVGSDLYLLELAHVEPDRGVELQGAAARRGFGAAEHHADLLAQLVDEDHHALGAR